MKRLIRLLILLLVLANICSAQIKVPYFGRIQWINGYAKEITGENIAYFSAYPDYATTALLTRCTNGNKIIEWETAPVPQNLKSPYVYFSWVAAHSSGTSKDKRNFDLYVNDQKLLTFTTFPANQLPVWTYGTNDSSRIVFQQTKRDASDDSHGLAFLRLPVSKIKPGLPVKLKVVGQAEGSNDWYMTFKFSFEEKIDVKPMPFLLKNGKQSLLLTALHFGNDQPLKVQVNKRSSYAFVVKNGINSFDIPVEAVKKLDSVLIQATVGDKLFIKQYFEINPVIYRELYFIHHSHTDIGYSHLQPEVLRIHMKNIDDALRMIDATKNFSNEAKFRWNVESLWVVENYLKLASQTQKEKFIKAVKEGSICLAGLYANILTGISEPEEVFHYTDYAEQLRNKYGVSIESAMISDIPGYAWTTVTGLAKGGIKYFSSGPNYLGETHPYLGDRVGYFVKEWGDKPVWWMSPSGKEKILFWTAGKGYSSWHGTAAGGEFDKGPKKIADYLNELSQKNYPYDIVQWRYNIVSDNGPIDSTISNFVEQWNKKYASPKIILSTTDKMFEAFEQKYGTKLPVVKGDITPYWEDGAFSTAFEEGKNRNNSLRLQQLAKLYSILNPASYSSEGFYQAWKNILLFHEHTWGAYNSTSEPDIPFVKTQWEIKKQFMEEADTQIDNLEKKLVNTFIDTSSGKIVVINTSSWDRSGPVEVKSTFNGRAVKDETGNLFPLQRLNDSTFVFLAENVPALGAAVFTVTKDVTSLQQKGFLVSDHSLSNGKITVQWDRLGSVAKLTDTNGFNYAGSFNQQGLNSYWYVPGLDPKQAQTNDEVQMKVINNGPVVTTIALTSEAPGSNRLERRLSLYSGSDELFIENFIDKKPVREKESVHFGFPFQESLSNITLDAGYGSIHYLSDQLPGSNMDFVYGRRWMDAANNARGIQLIVQETPLLEPLEMIDERRTINQSHKKWKNNGKPTATWFSYVMNNYWHTNYKADQHGVSRFRYVLRPHGTTDFTDIEKSAVEFSEPLLSFPVRENEKFSNGLFELTNNKILVTSITPSGENAFIVRLFNPDRSPQQTKFKWKSLKPSVVIDLTIDKPVKDVPYLELAGMQVLELKLIR